MGGITATRAMQLAERGVRDIRERIAMDTGIIPLSLGKAEYSEALRKIIAGSPAEYQELIRAKQDRRAAAEASALEAHSADSIESLSLTLPTHRALMSSGITTVGQLVAMSDADLRSLGRVNVKSIISRLGRLGLSLTKDTH